MQNHTAALTRCLDDRGLRQTVLTSRLAAPTGAVENDGIREFLADGRRNQFTTIKDRLIRGVTDGDAVWVGAGAGEGTGSGSSAQLEMKRAVDGTPFASSRNSM